MIKSSVLTVTLILSAFSTPAFACQIMSASIEGLGIGAKVNKNGVCEVLVEITKVVKRHPRCPLRVQVGKEVSVKTDLSSEKCPTDEVKLKGTLSDAGSGYFFRGTIQ